MTDTATTTKSPAKTDKPGKPQFHLVKLTHPNHHGRIVFRSISEARAKRFVQDRYPRGSEAYLEHPDGTAEHYEAERTGEFGMDAEPWAPFDPEAWVPPEQAPPPGDSEWADKEG
jgi:hypothetical protein